MVRIAVVLALVAALVRRSGRDEVAGVLLLAATAGTAGWAVLHLPALWHAIIPSRLPSSVVRAGLAVTCGLVVAAAVLALRMTGDAMGRRLSRAEGAGLPT
jgi:hypothetical protein